MTKQELQQYRSLVAEINDLKQVEKKEGETGKIKELSERVKSIESFIERIHDSEIRRIFFYRYIYGVKQLSWQEIAFRIGEYDESYPRRIHKRYMQAVESTELCMLSYYYNQNGGLEYDNRKE